MAPREPCEVDGRPVSDWLGLWAHCHANIWGSLVRLAWPDGRSLLEQPALLVAMFDLIREEAVKEMEAQQQRDV